MATLTATGNRKVQAGFEPLLTGFVRAPYNDVRRHRDHRGEHAEVVAILVEPVQGEGGILVPDDDYLAALRRICDAQGWLLMLDEVQTGNGRTGKFFAYQHTGIMPDVVTTAKGLGNGVPIGACLARGAAARSSARATTAPRSAAIRSSAPPPTRCSTHSIEDGLMPAPPCSANACSAVSQSGSPATIRVDIRGLGLMIGIELDAPPRRTSRTGASPPALLINVTHDNVVRLLPPLILSDAQADQIVEQRRRADRGLPAPRGVRDHGISCRCSTSRREELLKLIDRAIELKRMRQSGVVYEPLRGRSARDGLRSIVDTDAGRFRSRHRPAGRPRDHF